MVGRRGEQWRHGRGLGAPGGGATVHENAFRGSGRTRLGETNAMEGSPPRVDDGEEKPDGGGANSARWERAGEAEAYLWLEANLAARARGSRGGGGCPVRFGREVGGGPDGWGPPVSGSGRQGRCWAAAWAEAGRGGGAAAGLGREAGPERALAPFLFLFFNRFLLFISCSKTQTKTSKQIKQKISAAA